MSEQATRTPDAPKRAVALRYDPARDAAPRVLAVGQGAVADEILRRAREAGVAVTEDEALAAVLSKLDVGQAIPPELYVVVAEVLAYVYRLEKRVARRR
jgi:flagellar biosynthesis protein